MVQVISVVAVMETVVDHLFVKVEDNGLYMVQSAGDQEGAQQVMHTLCLLELVSSGTG